MSMQPEKEKEKERPPRDFLEVLERLKEKKEKIRRQIEAAKKEKEGWK